MKTMVRDYFELFSGFACPGREQPLRKKHCYPRLFTILAFASAIANFTSRVWETFCDLKQVYWRRRLRLMIVIKVIVAAIATHLSSVYSAFQQICSSAKMVPEPADRQPMLIKTIQIGCLSINPHDVDFSMIWDRYYYQSYCLGCCWHC